VWCELIPDLLFHVQRGCIALVQGSGYIRWDLNIGQASTTKKMSPTRIGNTLTTNHVAARFQRTLPGQDLMAVGIGEGRKLVSSLKY
jgi:hypothetical protein